MEVMHLGAASRDVTKVVTSLTTLLQYPWFWSSYPLISLLVLFTSCLKHILTNEMHFISCVTASVISHTAI